MANIFEVNRPNNKITLGTSGTTINIASHTASLLLALDINKDLESVSDLTGWIAGTANQVIVTDDTDGTVTLSTPQDIHTAATPTFAGGTETGDLTFYDISGNSPKIHLDANQGGTREHSEIYTVAAGFPGFLRIATPNVPGVATPVLDIYETALLFSTDNKVDIGASGANRPKDYYGSGNITIGGIGTFGGLVLPKTSGVGIKVDTASPTFGFADIIGDQFSKNTGATKPTLAAYNGVVQAWQFANGDEAYMTYHIPHDYVLGTDIHLHIHWSQNNVGATGGTIDFIYTAIYAKGWNQATGSTFTSTPITATFSSININDGSSGLSRYQQHITEVTISAATATAALFDRDDFEPDGVIELTIEMDATNLTGTPSDPFIHYADIHYQTTGLIGTKSRTPDFYT